ncbi:hypothetical protein SDC9_180723 [bioreactor metagenome]|uniref:Uncharacterized protein n=1 Tax=bioreactor metagenome TaxID=1076179 RepID=A0A645H5A8_9ZZZZ
MPDEGLRCRPHGEGVGEEDRCLEGAHLLHLDEPGGLSEAVDHVAGGEELFPEEVASVGQNGGDPRLHGAVGQGAVAHPDSLHVGDGVPGSPGQYSWFDAVVGYALAEVHEFISLRISSGITASFYHFRPARLPSHSAAPGTSRYRAAHPRRRSRSGTR